MKTNILILILILQASFVTAANYIVDGSTTIQEVLNIAGAGDTVFISGGTYYESYLEPNSGTSNEWLVITNIPGEEVILNGGGPSAENYNCFSVNNKSFVEISGLRITEYYDIGIDLRECGSITVRNCELDHNGSAGVALNYAVDETKIIVEDCICHHNGWGIGWASGIHLNNKGHATNEPHIIRRNICYNNFDGSDYHTDGNGIMFDVAGGGLCIIENNICFNNGGSGINVLDGNAFIVNNTLYRNGYDISQDWLHEIYLGQLEEGNVTNIILQNNIIYARENVPCLDYNDIDINNISFNANLCWSDNGSSGVILPSGFESLLDNPAFINAPVNNEVIFIHDAPFIDMNFEDYNFYLQQNSPAIDAGLANNAPNHDIEGNTRPIGNNYDIGAYEFNSTTDIVESNQHLQFKVSPNPARGFIKLESTSNYSGVVTIEVYSAEGRKLKVLDKVSTQQLFDVSDFQSGLYYLKIYARKNKIQIIKLIKH